MGRKNAVGVANGNFRNGDYYQYALAVARGWNNRTVERAMNKKKMRAMYWTQRLANAMGILSVTDPNWEAWYDDDRHVPSEASDREFAILIEARVYQLKSLYPILRCRAHRDIFIWTDEFNGVFVYSKEIGKKALYAIEFNTVAEAEAFLNGLPTDNCGYGVVLDILPAGSVTNAESI